MLEGTTMEGAAMWWRKLWPFGAGEAPAGGAAGPARQRAAAVSARRTGYLDPRSFVTALDGVFAAAPGPRNRLSVLSLADFREAVGPKWPRLADKVATVADCVIRRHLDGGHDLFTQLDGETFVIAMPRCSREEARARITEIAEDLTVRLLGDGLVGGRRPAALAANLAFDEARAAGGGLDREAIRQAAEESRSLLAVARLAGAAAGARGEPLLTSLADQGEAVAGPEWEYFHRAHAAAGPDLDERLRPLPRDAVLSVLWRPTWVADSEAICAYLARVVRIDHPGAAPVEGALAYPLADPAGVYAIDRFVVARAVRDLKAGEAAERRTAVILPLSWTSLTPERRGELLLPLADLHPRTRGQLLKIEVFNIPDDATGEQMAGLMDFFRHIGCAVMLRRHLEARPPPTLGPAPDVGIDLAELRPDERVGDAELVARLERLKRAAEAGGQTCHLWGVRRRPVIARLVADGFRMINGPGLMADVGQPSAILPAPRKTLVAA